MRCLYSLNQYLDIKNGMPFSDTPLLKLLIEYSYCFTQMESSIQLNVMPYSLNQYLNIKKRSAFFRHSVA